MKDPIEKGVKLPDGALMTVWVQHGSHHLSTVGSPLQGNGHAGTRVEDGRWFRPAPGSQEREGGSTTVRALYRIGAPSSGRFVQIDVTNGVVDGRPRGELSARCSVLRRTGADGYEVEAGDREYGPVEGVGMRLAVPWDADEGAERARAEQSAASLAVAHGIIDNLATSRMWGDAVEQVDMSDEYRLLDEQTVWPVQAAHCAIGRAVSQCQRSDLDMRRLFDVAVTMATDFGMDTMPEALPELPPLSPNGFNGEVIERHTLEAGARSKVLRNRILEAAHAELGPGRYGAEDVPMLLQELAADLEGGLVNAI